MKRHIFRLVFATWVVLWLLFFTRELIIKGAINDYIALTKRTLEGKHAYITGDRLYELLEFSKSNMPLHATYGFVGIEEGRDKFLDERRAIYYLYPDMKSDDPEYVIVYGVPGYAANGYEIFKRLDGTRYILKRASL